MSDNHQIQQPIVAVQLPCDENGNLIDYMVGQNCERIEACEKNGEYCTIPYLRIWSGQNCLAEFCQHKASYIRFGVAP